LLIVRFGVGAAYPWLDPTLAGLAAAAVAFAVIAAVCSKTGRGVTGSRR
jgi:hypothetical protein